MQTFDHIKIVFSAHPWARFNVMDLELSPRHSGSDHPHRKHSRSRHRLLHTIHGHELMVNAFVGYCIVGIPNTYFNQTQTVRRR